TDSLEQYHRESVKTDCTCFINMYWPLKSSNPTITKMNLEHHRHDLNPRIIRFADIYRQLSQNIMDKIQFYVNTIYDINQYTLRQLLCNPENDALNLFKELQKMKKNDSTWFITYHCIKNHLYYIFWMIPYQQTLYLKYYDHHYSRVVAQALMLDETTSSYIWVLKNLLAATNNLSPMIIYSDCDTELGLAIESVLPTT
ncbi:5511_t:CDS:2, partial [Racocetra persica]